MFKFVTIYYRTFIFVLSRKSLTCIYIIINNDSMALTVSKINNYNVNWQLHYSSRFYWLAVAVVQPRACWRNTGIKRQASGGTIISLTKILLDWAINLIIEQDIVRISFNCNLTIFYISLLGGQPRAVSVELHIELHIFSLFPDDLSCRYTYYYRYVEHTCVTHNHNLSKGYPTIPSVLVVGQPRAARRKWGINWQVVVSSFNSLASSVKLYM